MSTIAVNSITPSTGSTVSIDNYVPIAQFGWKNKIINGSMDIAQRGTSFAAAANFTYPVDRYFWVQSAASVVTLTQQADAPTNNEFQNSLRVAVTTADASIAATDYATIFHKVEGYNVRDLIGKTFTLSFWVRSSKTGTHCVSFVNSGGDRSYVAEYTVSAANTWEQKSITVVGGLITAGTWNWTNGAGVNLTWTLAAGSNFQTTAGAWQTGTFSSGFMATANQVNCLDTIGNIFAITGVQLEVGSVATPFEHRPFGAELALCQRYLPRVNANARMISSIFSTTGAIAFANFPVTPRVAPTGIEIPALSNFAMANNGGTTGVPTAVSFSAAGTDGCRITVTTSAGSPTLAAGQPAEFQVGASGYIQFTGCEL